MKKILLVKSTKADVSAMREALQLCRDAFKGARITALGPKLAKSEHDEFMRIDSDKHIAAVSTGACALLGLLASLRWTGFDLAVLVGPAEKSTGLMDFFIRFSGAKERRSYHTGLKSFVPLVVSAAELDGLAPGDAAASAPEPGVLFLLRRLFLAFCLTAFAGVCIAAPLRIRRLLSR
ncbi:MAG: hypothetical protein ABIG11_09700 [bacterium]